MDLVILRPMCDLCPDDSRAPASHRVVIAVGVAEVTAAADGLPKPSPMLVDLCPNHLDPAIEANGLAAAGRNLSRRGTPPASYPSGKRIGRPATPGGQPSLAIAGCPVCGKAMRRKTWPAHLRQVHGWVNPRSPKRCPDCGLRVDAGQPMTTHRARAHGWDFLAAMVEANT